jgi:hypothetical protein
VPDDLIAWRSHRRGPHICLAPWVGRGSVVQVSDARADALGVCRSDGQLAHRLDSRHEFEDLAAVAVSAPGFGNDVPDP